MAAADLEGTLEPEPELEPESEGQEEERQLQGIEEQLRVADWLMQDMNARMEGTPAPEDSAPQEGVPAKAGERGQEQEERRRLEDWRRRQERAQQEARAQQALGEADQALAAGTRLQVEGHGIGVYDGWKKKRMGANEHRIRFGEATRMLALRELNWRVVLEPEPEPELELEQLVPQPEPQPRPMPPMAMLEPQPEPDLVLEPEPEQPRGTPEQERSNDQLLEASETTSRSFYEDTLEWQAERELQIEAERLNMEEDEAFARAQRAPGRGRRLTAQQEERMLFRLYGSTTPARRGGSAQKHKAGPTVTGRGPGYRPAVVASDAAESAKQAVKTMDVDDLGAEVASLSRSVAPDPSLSGSVLSPDGSAWETDSMASSSLESRSEARLAMCAEVAVSRLKAEQMRARKLEQELSRLRRRKAVPSRESADARGPSHLPGFLWPTHQQDVKLGGALYSKQGKDGGTAESRSKGVTSPQINKRDIDGWATSLRDDKPPEAARKSNGSRKFRSSPIRIDKVDASTLSKEVKYPNRPNAGSVLDSSGDGKQWRMEITVPVHELSDLRKRMESLEASVAQVVEDPSVIQDWDGTFDTAVQELAQAAKDLDAGGGYEAQKKLESWSKLVWQHPEYLEKEEEFRQWWEDENAAKLDDALATMRRRIPRDAVRPEFLGRRTLVKRGMPEALARRLHSKRILSFIWMDPAEIDELQFSELDVKYWAYGLDIVEMRAVFAQLPRRFSTDPDGRKTEWLSEFKQLLVDLSAEEAAGTLADARAIHHAYRELIGQPLTEHEQILMEFFQKHEPSYANAKKIRQLSNFFRARVERENKGAESKAASIVEDYRPLFAAVTEGVSEANSAASRRALAAQDKLWRTVMYDEFTTYYKADPRRVWQFSKRAHQQQLAGAKKTAESLALVADVEQPVMLRTSSSGAKSTGVLELGASRTRCEFATAAFGASSAQMKNIDAVCAKPLLADRPLTNPKALRGRLAIIMRGAVSFATKARHAQQAGARGVIFVNTDEELFIVGGEEGDEDISIPIIGLRASDGSALVERSEEAKAVRVNLSYNWSDDDPESSDDEGNASDTSEEWDADRLAALIPPGTRDAVLDELRVAAAALGRDPQRPAGAAEWDARVRQMQDEFERTARKSVVGSELSQLAGDGMRVESFAARDPADAPAEEEMTERARRRQEVERRKAQEMEAVEKATSTGATLAGGVDVAKHRYESIARNSTAELVLQEAELRRRQAGGHSPPQFPAVPAEAVPEGVPPAPSSPRAATLQSAIINGASAGTAHPLVRSPPVPQPEPEPEPPSRRPNGLVRARAKAKASLADGPAAEPGEEELSPQKPAAEAEAAARAKAKAKARAAGARAKAARARQRLLEQQAEGD